MRRRLQYCRWNHEWTPENTIPPFSKKGKRRCRACKEERQQRKLSPASKKKDGKELRLSLPLLLSNPQSLEQALQRKVYFQIQVNNPGTYGKSQKKTTFFCATRSGRSFLEYLTILLAMQWLKETVGVPWMVANKSRVRTFILEMASQPENWLQFTRIYRRSPELVLDSLIDLYLAKHPNSQPQTYQDQE